MPTPHEPRPNALRPLTILVVDDDPGTRSFARKTLGEAGYRVETSSTLEVAAQVERVDPDLVLLDVDAGNGAGASSLQANGILVRSPSTASLSDAVCALLARPER